MENYQRNNTPTIIDEGFVPSSTSTCMSQQGNQSDDKISIPSSILAHTEQTGNPLSGAKRDYPPAQHSEL